jgi:hypothetical protein
MERDLGAISQGGAVVEASAVGSSSYISGPLEEFDEPKVRNWNNTL